MRILLALLTLAGCVENLDSVMWSCQLEVQKDNAGKSVDAIAQKARDIEICMELRGYRLDIRNSACVPGSTQSACYRPK
jgi:hypothetical protein